MVASLEVFCFPAIIFFFILCIRGRREFFPSLCASHIQRLRQHFGRLASSFMNIHPGIICLSGRRRRLLTSVGWCELPHNHSLTFSYGATVEVKLTLLLSPPSSNVSLHHHRGFRQHTTNEKSGGGFLLPVFIFRTLFFNTGRSRLS